MYGQKYHKKNYFVKFIYANTKDMNYHLIKINLQKYTSQVEKYMSTWNNLQSKLCITEICFIWEENKMLHVKFLGIKANKEHEEP